jgi:hypothetical protein
VDASLRRLYSTKWSIRSIFSLPEAPGGQHSVTFNIPALDQILDDVGSLAEGYPPHFDSIEDRQRAEHDVSGIAKLLDPSNRVETERFQSLI